MDNMTTLYWNTARTFKTRKQVLAANEHTALRAILCAVGEESKPAIRLKMAELTAVIEPPKVKISRRRGGDMAKYREVKARCAERIW
jgi:hypothetical protein